MSVRSLIGKIPYIAGCKHADRFSERNLMIFDHEVSNPKSIFAYRKSDAYSDRLAVLEIPPEYIGDKNAYRFAMDRIEIAMMSQDRLKGRITPERQKMLSELADLHLVDMPTKEGDMVSRELTIVEAVRGVWNP